VIAAHGGLVALLGGKGLGSDKYFRKLFEDTFGEPARLNFNAKKDKAVYQVNGTMKLVRV